MDLFGGEEEQPTGLAIPLKDGTHYQVTTTQHEKWQQAFPNLDVDRELYALIAWCDANKAKRKTSAGVERFVHSWLSRAHDRGGSPQAGKVDLGTPQHPITRTRDMTSLDDLSHNFLGDPAISEHFLAKFGQVFENGVRRTK